MVFVVVNIVEIKIECQAKLGSLSNMFAVEMHAMTASWEITYALESKVIVKPQQAKDIGFGI